MKDFKGQEKTVVRKTSEEVRVLKRGKASCPGASTRRADSGTSGSKVNTHHGGRFIAALLVVLLSFIMILGSIPQAAFADDLDNTVPNDETPTGDNFYSDTIYTGFVPNGYTYSSTYGPSFGPHSVPGVVQSQSTQSPTSFAAGLPLGTIFIDQEEIKSKRYTVKAEIVSKDTEIIAGLKVDYSKDGASNAVGYDGTLPGARKMVPGKVNVLEGDLFTVTFKDAAILPNGDRANLRITYSNARIVIDERYMAAPLEDRYYHGAVYLAQGNAFIYGGTDNTDMTATYGDGTTSGDGTDLVNTTANVFGDTYAKQSGNNAYPATGLTMDATCKIVDDDGVAVPGTYVFAISGINLDRDPDVGGSNNVAKPLWYSALDSFDSGKGLDHSFFSEAIEIRGGQAADYVYVRPNTGIPDNPEGRADVRGQYFWSNVDLHNGNIKFIGNGTNSPSMSGHDESYSAGFVTLADAAAGFQITATGHGNYGQLMNSLVFGSKQIWYRYISGSGKHGKIETTSEGNWGGTLSKGTVLDGGKNPYASDATSADKANTYVITEGKTVTYTMTPDIGYKMKKLTVNGAEVKVNGEPLSSMKKGDTVTVTTAAGKEGILTYRGDGTYTFVFPYAEHDEEIFVEWEPVSADILASKVWEDEDDKDGMRRLAYSDLDTTPKFRLEYSINGGKTWSPVNNNTIGNTAINPSRNYSSSGTAPLDTNPIEIPSGYDSATDKYLDGTYVINNGATGTREQTPAVLPVDPSKFELVPRTKTEDHYPVYKYTGEGSNKNKLFALVNGSYHEFTPSSEPALIAKATISGSVADPQPATVPGQFGPAGLTRYSQGGVPATANEQPVYQDASGKLYVYHDLSKIRYLKVQRLDSPAGTNNGATTGGQVSLNLSDLQLYKVNGVQQTCKGLDVLQLTNGTQYVVNNNNSYKFRSVDPVSGMDVYGTTGTYAPDPTPATEFDKDAAYANGFETTRDTCGGDPVLRDPKTGKLYVEDGGKYYEVTSLDHPFTWENLPVYTYDSNGTADRLITYRLVETVKDPDTGEYKEKNPILLNYQNVEYRDAQAFELTSETSKSWDGWMIYEDKNDATKHYVLKGDGKYYEVSINSNKEKDGIVSENPATNQPNKDDLRELSSNEYRTVDKAIPYQQIHATNRHGVSDIDVEVTKEWNDAALYDSKNHKPIEGGAITENQYDRKDITFVLHGTINDGAQVVDLNPSDPSTDDIEITLSKDELNTRRQTAGGEPVYRDKSTKKKYVRTGGDGSSSNPYVYNEVTNVDNKNTGATGSYESSPAPTQPLENNIEEVYNTAYAVYEDEDTANPTLEGTRYGVVFEGLQAYWDGHLIEYTVTEKMDKADSFTVTGGTIETVTDATSGNVTGFTMSDLQEVKDDKGNLKGYKGNFTNTPIIEDKYEPLPVKIKKLDAYTGQPLPNAEFTIFADPATDLLPRTSTYKQIGGLTVYKNASDKQYVKKADGKYYEVNGDNISSTAANPQPAAADLEKVKNQNFKKVYESDTDRVGLEVWTDKRGHEYVLKEGNYYEVDLEGKVASTKANPQPNPSTLSRIEVPGEVDEIVVVTDERGEVTVNFNSSGIYTIEETKAPDGYTGDTKSYQFDASTELKKIEYKNPNENHATHWWERLYDLIFGPRTNTETNWKQTDTRTGELTVKDDPLTAHILVRKVWDDANDQDGVRPKDSEPDKLPTMTLQYTTKDPATAAESDWQTAQIFDPDRETAGQPDPGLVNVDDKKTSYAGGAIHKDNNNAYTWTDLPAYRDGKVVYYRIKETGTVLTDGTYEITSNKTVATGDENFKLVDGSNKSTNQIVEVTNTHKPQTLTINAIKRWVDNGNKLEHRPGTLKIALYKDVDNQETKIFELVLDGNGVQMPNESDYDLDSDSQLDDTTPVYDLNNDGEPETTEKGAYDAAVAAVEAVLNSGAYELDKTDDNTWNAIFKNLPAYANGAPIKYRLEETLEGDAKTWYVNKYYASYKNTAQTNVKYEDTDHLIANDVFRTKVTETETVEIESETYTVYTKNGKKYVRKGEGTTESPHKYYEIKTDGSVDFTKPADPQPINPIESTITTETTEATLEVDNISKNNAETKKYWIGGSNANVRFYLYRTTVDEFVNKDEPTDTKTAAEYLALPEKAKGNYAVDPTDSSQYINIDDPTDIISDADYENLPLVGKINYSPVAPEMSEVTSTATPIKSGTQIIIANGDITGTFDLYTHANGKRYVYINTDTSNPDAMEWHEVLDNGTKEDTSDDTISNTVAVIKVKTWTPYDLDPDGNPKYVKKDGTGDPITAEAYAALSDEEKAKYEIKPNPIWERVTDGDDRGEHLFVSSAFNTVLSWPGDDENHLFENLPDIDPATNKPYVYRVFETTTAGNWTDERFEGHYSEDGLTVTNINKLMEEGSADVDVLKDLTGREWDAKFKRTGVEADKDEFFFWIEPIKGIDETTGEIIEFISDPNDPGYAADQALKAKVPLPGDGNQWGRAVSQNTAVGTTAREVSFSPILYDATDIDTDTKTSTFYYKVYEAKNNQGTIVTEKDDKGITYDGGLVTDPNSGETVWKPKTEVMKVVATADANNVVTAEHSWESIKRNAQTGAFEGIEWTTQTPVFKNTYSSEGFAKAWIEKNIQSRAWVDYSKDSSGKQTGDAYQFTITSIAGANLNTEGATPDDSYVTMPLVTSTTDKNPQHDLEKLSNSMWAFGVNGNPYSGELLGKNGEAYFIYEITENGAATTTPRDELDITNYTVDGLTYDDSRIFAKVKVTDNWDGTLRFDVRYYTDASCKEGTEITNHKVWIVDKPLIESYVSKADPTVTKSVEEYNGLTDAEKTKYEAVYSYVDKNDPSKTKTATQYSELPLVSQGNYTANPNDATKYINNDKPDDIISATDWGNLPTGESKQDYINRLKRLLNETERAAAEAIENDTTKSREQKDAELAALGYRLVNVAHFENRETIDIPVKKQWIDGPAIEDVTLHLERHLFPLSNETNLDGENGVGFVQEKSAIANWNPENYINKTNYADVKTKAEYEALSAADKAKYEVCGPFWERLGYVYDVRRGEFLKQNGDPKYDAGSDNTSSLLIENAEGFNKDLPKYVVKNGITYRAVYLLVEDNTSDAYSRDYSPKYSVTNNGVETTGALYINENSLSGTDAALVVKNTVVATNTANIAAVKQLLGRNWIKDKDDFEFELIPYGVAVYNENDEIVDIDKSEAGKAKVPMPKKNTSLYSDTVIKGYINKNDETTTKTATQYSELPLVSQGNYTVDPNDATKYINNDDPDDIISATDWGNLPTGESKQDYVAQKESTTHAKEKDGAIVVDPNGNLERLARFGAITYTTSDLEYDKTDRHMQGDFYYIMREKMPEIVTTGEDQLYPVEYTVINKTTKKAETRKVADADRGVLPTAEDGETLKSIKFSNGITYDCDEHTVHVKVRENRTKDLQVQIAYDYDDRADIASGTQFTPVYTNKYEAETEVTVPVNKYIMGRDWVAKDNFDFRMIPMAGAPFTDADPTDFPEQNTYSHTERNTQLDAGNAVHNKEGEHVIRVTPDKGTTGNMTGTHKPVSFDFPAIKINISDLNKVITEENRTEPEPNKPDLRVYDVAGYNMAEGAEKETHLLPLGTVYGQFMYAIEETNEFNDVNTNVVKDLEPDPDTEYARVTVYDIGDGVLRHYVEIFEDRYGSIPRYVPDLDTGEKTDVRATAVTFANKYRRNLKATKAWAGPATEDVTLKLQWSLTQTKDGWFDADGTDWFPNEVGTKVIKKDATGEALTVEWTDLPAYANITGYTIAGGSEGADDIDLNDKWVYYRVVEVTPEHATVKYNETPYNEITDKITDGKFKDVPFNTGAEFKEKTDPADPDEYLTPDERVKQLYLTNFPEDITGKAKVGVVKQYIGKEWDNEEFKFIITPVESKLASDTAFIKQGDNRTTTTYVHNDTGAVIGPVAYGKLSDAEKEKYTKHESTVTNNLPEYTGTDGNTAIAKKSSDPKLKVSVNEFAANFKDLIIKRSDLGHNLDTNEVGGEFIYKITEIIPETNKQKTNEVCGKDANGNDTHYYVADDKNGNKIKYTTVEHLVKIVVKDDGSGELDVEVSFDDRNSGEYVPVYTNYALAETPIEGEKKWVGGEKSEHQNGTVTLMNEDTEIDPSVEPVDELDLKLQRSTDGTNFTDVATDAAGNKLYIVWAKQTRTSVPSYSYTVTDDTEVDSDKTYYNEATGEAITPDGTEQNPHDLGWCEREEIITYKYAYEKQEGDPGTGKGNSGPYTYTIKAKKETKDPVSGDVIKTEYVDPYLDTTDKDGNEYIYRIQETKVPTNYKESYDPVKLLNVTNIYDVTDNLKVTKTWDDAQGVEGTRPEEVIVHLYKEVIVPAETPGGSATTKTVQVEVDKKTITKQGTETDSWSTGITWEDLPLYDDNGNVIKYFVLEEGIGGYVAKYAVDSTAEADYKAAGDASLKIELDGNSTHAATQAEADAGLAENVGDTITVTPQTIDIKNSLTPATNTVKVTKVWDDQNNIDGARPTDGVTFQLYKYVWDPDANSGKGAYDTTEKLVSGTSGTGRPATQADVDADKAAKEAAGETSTMKVGDIIKIEDLVLDGTAETDEDGSTPSTDDDVDTQANETAPTNTYTWNGEWINLPLTENGKTILYFVKEVIPTGTDSAYADPGTPGKYSNKPVIIGDQIKGYTVTNEYTPEETTFVGTKSWVDGDTSITHNNSAELMSQLHLYRTTVAPADWDDSTTWTDMGLLSTGVANGDYHVDWTTTTQKDDTFTITGLAKKDGSGKTYYYKIVEAEITGYETTYLNGAATVDALKTKTDALYSGGTVENAAKVGDVEITKKFVDSEGKIIPKAVLPSGFKIKVSYVWNNPTTKKFETKTAELTIGDLTADADGNYKWTLERVVAGTKVTAEEVGYDSPTGYSYVSTTATVNGDDDATHVSENPTYAEFTMPAGAANTTPAVRSYNPGTGGNTKPSIALVNTYNRDKGAIAPIKIWDDDSDAASTRPDSVTFTITATKDGDLNNTYAVIDDGTGTNTKVASINYTMTKTDNSGDEWFINAAGAFEIGDLPTHADDGTQICYVITENTVPTGYQRLYPQADVGGIKIRLNKGDYKYAEITNSYTEFVVTKKWIDVDGTTATPTAVRPTTAAYKDMVKLYAGSEDVTAANASKLTVTDNGDGTYTLKWTGLPKRTGGDLTKPEIVYSVVENPNPITGYSRGVYSNPDNPNTRANEASETSKALKGGTITNTQLVKVSVVKEWNDNGNHDNQRPEQIKVTLYQNGVPYGSEKTLTKATATVGANAGNDTWTWTDAWTNLPYADDNGSVYNYTATETNLGTGTGLWGNLDNEATIRQILLNAWNTNKDTLTFSITNTDAEDKIGFTVDKIWNDASDVDNLRPDTINYRLYQSWEGHAEELVKELPTGATVNTVTNGADPVLASYANGYITIASKKTDETQGTLNRVIFEGLPKFAAGGKKITYTIKEDGDVTNDTVNDTTVNVTIDPIRGYNTGNTGQMPTMGGSQTAGYTVTNSHTPVSVSVSPNAIKQIAGRKFRNGEEFTFKLESTSTDAPMPTPGWVTIKAGLTDILSNTKNIPLGTFTFTGEDMTDKLNAGDTKTFTYKLSEVNGGKTYDDLYYDHSELTLKITVTRKADGTLEIPASGVVWGDGSTGSDTFVNRYGANTILTLRKVWVDDDADGTVLEARPTSVDFTVTAEITTDDGVWATDAENKLLLADFTKVNSKKYTKVYTLTTGDAAAQDTEHTWQIDTEELPKMDAAGDAIIYSVSEDQLPNYKEPKLVQKGNLYTITNEYDRITFTGTKVWTDGGKTHDNVTELKNALTVEREETVYVYDGTSYSTRAAAEAQATTDGVDPADFDTVITTDKEWKTVTDANLHIHWNGDGAASGGKYTQSFTVTGLLEKDALGNAYKYRVVEDGTVVQAINPDYVVSYDNNAATDAADQSKTDAIYNGGKVENKLEGEKEITAEKVWVGGDAADHDNSLITSVELWRESTTNGGAEAEAKVAAATAIDNWTATEGDAEFDFGAIDSGTSAFVTGKYDKYDDEGFGYRYFVKNEVLDPSIANMYIPSYEDLTVTNTYKYTEVEVTKKWTGKPEADVTIKLLADGTEVADYTFAVDDLVDGKYTHTFTKKGTNNAGPALLDRFTATGDEVVYTVQEVNGDLYDADIIQTGSGDWVVINTGKYIDIAVRKVWDDKDDHDGLRPDAIEITLLQNGSTYSATGFTNPAVLNEDNNWTYIFKELPRKDTDGNLYVYKVNEATVPTGYTVSYLSEDATDSKTDGTVTTSNEVTITNRHAVATEDVVATKVWDDGVAGSAEMHTDVVLHLYGTNSNGRILYDAGIKKIEMDANHQPLDSNGNPIEVRWTDLPSRHYSNEDLIWVIVEEAVPGYSSKVEEVSPNNFKVTNTYDGPVTKITVEKDWQDNDDVDGKRPTTVSYQLWKKVGDSAAEKVGVAVEAVKTPASPATDATGQLNNWGYQWTNLPTTEEVKTGTENVDRLEVVTRYRNIHDDTNISADEYDVLPASGPTKSDYELKTQVVPVDPPRWINGDGTIELDQTDYEDLTPAEQAEYTPVTEVKPVDPTTYVNKNDGTEKNEAEYNALTEWTKADYEPYDSETSTPEAVDVYETKPVIYYVTEEYTGTDLETNGYEEPVIEALGGGQYKAINTRKRDTKNLEIQKVWNDNDNADGVRPDHVTFKLTTEDGQTYIHAGEKTIANILVGEDNGWKVVIHDVPVNQDGAVNTPVKYIVEELTVPTGYHVSYFSEDAAGDKTDGTIGSSKKLTVTNTHTPGETMTVKVIKKWQDSGGTELPSQPHEVKFRLIQVHNDGTIKDMGDTYEQTIPAGAEGDDLIVIWTGLPEMVNHLPVTYTVEEEPIDGYTTIMSDGVADPEPGIDLEITVTNKKHMITVTYKEPAAFNDEILQGPDEIARDQNEPDAPADPVHPGYTFLGWTRVEDASGNVVYTAKYAELVDVVTPSKVTYVDPKAADGSMILKATKYNTSAEADDAAQNKTDKPENPSHENYDFVGWVLNQDQFGDWIIVAKYNEKLPEPAPAKKTTSYIDPVSGKLIKSEVTDDPSSVIPPTPSTYGNMQFVEWAEIVDANGNTVFVAKYATDCKNAPPSTPADPPAIAPPTGDENNMMLWIYLAIAALATIMIVLIIRRRNQSR